MRIGERCGWDRLKFDPNYEIAVLATIATIMVRLPTTEAVCERAISWFKWIFNTHRMRSDVDLITAEMVIRARQIRLHAEDVGDFEFEQPKLL
jgi:hypothetical protein